MILDDGDVMQRCVSETGKRQTATVLLIGLLKLINILHGEIRGKKTSMEREF